MKQKKLNIIFIIISFTVLIGYVYFTEGVDNLKKGFEVANHLFLLLALSFIVIYWFLESLVLHVIIKTFFPSIPFFDSFKSTMVGHFFNLVTPFASGGQPMQAYSLVKSGVPLGLSTCSLLIKFIIYQITLTVYSLVAIILRFSYFREKIHGFTFLVIIGFVVNTLVLIALFSVFFFKGFTVKAGEGIIKFLSRIKIIKDPESSKAKLNREIDEFYLTFTLLKNHVPLVLYSIIISALQLLVFFTITYIIAFAFNIKNISFINMTCAQSFVAMITSFIPIPGAAGGAEVSFVLFFEMFFHKLVTIAMLIWRIITFYVPIAVGIFFVFNSKRKENA